MEHRYGGRVSVDLPVRLQRRGGDLVNGRIVNISRSGALIRTSLPLTSLAFVDIHLEGQIVASFVTRVEDHDIGVEWCNSLPAIDAIALHTLHAAAAAAPELLETT